MVRKHGWQLPAHKFQHTMLSLPFVGGRIWEYILLGVYSPVALIVFVLYVRCTAINPADPGIMSKFERGGGDMGHHDLPSKDIARRFSEAGSHLQSSPSVASRTLLYQQTLASKALLETLREWSLLFRGNLAIILWLSCAWFVYEDCRKKEEIDEQQGDREEALFCTLCNAELIIEAAVGIAVIVRVFVNKREMETEIVNRLGNGFSRAPFATVVGITTYEYVVAMRAMTTRAAARARASSSVLRPIENRHAQDDELSSSGTMSVVSSLLLRDVRRTSVVWDQEAGRYVSVPATTSEARTRLASHHQPIPSSHARIQDPFFHLKILHQGKPLHPPPPQQGEKLMYTGDSIFFGGPLVNILTEMV
ncbi:hypothetical protein Bca52824_087665 [Brassica carinata]|uniref:Uncharacterized protein n=1 Tax=Brassica carinata TaxID=52824 RepID=A0A8X7PCC9_BRACI|nr:hypothetical protein Bca52824_087665 [Brassica carinata]